MAILNEVKLARELIKFPSITPVDAGVMRFLEKKLQKIGFKTKILEFKEKGFQPVKNLYARLGSEGPNFMFAGHVDIVPPGNVKDWTINPFKPSIKNGHLIGRGADMLTVKELLGHSSLSSTQHYTQLNLETIKKVYQKNHPRGE